MTAAFRYLKSQCPICQGQRRDCRQSTTTEAVHCRADVMPPQGWELTGMDTQGFAIYVLGAKAANPSYWAERERQRQMREQQAKAALGKLLSVPLRDRMFRSIARFSGLASRHREALQRRCDDAEIPHRTIDYLCSKSLLWTWQPGETFPGVTAALPGVNRWGELSKIYQGFAIGIPDANGHILGAQIKPETGDGYLWLSSANRDGNGPQLPNGELPMGVYWPSNLRHSDRIGLAEGYLKPAIAAERFGIPFLGVSGGRFPAQQFEQALQVIRGQLPKAKLILFPDAGQLDEKHSNVHGAWRSLKTLCEKLKEPLEAAWWGQTNKADGDVDEARKLTIHAARLITPEELLDKVTQSGQNAWQKRWEAQVAAAWNRTRRYTATEVVNTRFAEVELGDVLSADIHALKSSMGTGKTQAIAQLMKETDLGVVAIGSRNSLLLQSCDRWGGFYHLHSDTAFGLTADPHSRIACCVDSLIHFGDNHFEGKIVILDEVLSIVKHALLSSTLKDKRSKVLAKFEKAIKTAAAIIAWDGNNADIAINYLAALRGDGCRVRKVLNEWSAATLDVEMVRVLGQNGNVWPSNHRPILTKVGEALRTNRDLGNGKGVVVIADSQRLCEALDDAYTEQGFNVLRVDANTSGDETIRQFLKGPDEFIPDTRPDLLVMSPTAESGLDISTRDYFNHGFALFFGEIDTATQMQFMRRVRHCHDWTVWCVEYKVGEDAEGSRSPLARKVGSQILDYLQADVGNALKDEPSHLVDEFLQQLKIQSTGIHYQTTLQFMAARNYELQHVRECLQQSLEEAGHTVRLVDLDGSAKSTDTEAISEAKEQGDIRHSEKTHDAPEISISEAARIASSFSSSPEQRYAAEKAILKSRLPGIENSSAWSPEFIREVLFKDRGLIKRLERYWMLKHLEAARQRSKEMYLKVLEYGGFAPDIKSDLRLLQALDHLGIHQLPETLEPYDNNSPHIQQIAEKCKRSKKLQAALGRSPGKLKPLDWVGRLCRIVGIFTISHPKPRSQRGEGGVRNYSYHSPESDPICAEILKCLDRRFEKYLHPEMAETPPQQQPTPDHLPLNTNPLPKRGDPPQSKTGSDAYGFNKNDIAEVREMRAALVDDADALAEFRESIRIHQPGLWEASA
ncbi:MAG: hypothetical protein F6J95_023915 [Leptolyngbya sp. SIO1E4]|nr:hypothetical protein [Leptolyngbya sp. SIO1E4]